MKQPWDTDEIILLKAFVAMGYTRLEISNELNRSINSIQSKIKRLNITRKYNKLTHNEYVEYLHYNLPTIIVLEDFKGNNTPILHKCLECNIEYKVQPNSKLKNKGCKNCNRPGGIRLDKPGITYLIEDLDNNLFKIGITGKSVKERLFDVGIEHYEIILERHFKTGLEARKQEDTWLKNVSKYLINTGLLKNGNSETFIY